MIALVCSPLRGVGRETAPSHPRSGKQGRSSAARHLNGNLQPDRETTFVEETGQMSTTFDVIRTNELEGWFMDEHVVDAPAVRAR
jgi:hypothetical protein